MTTYELKNLPNDVKNVLIQSRHLKNVEQHRKEILDKKFLSNKEINSGSLMDMLDETPSFTTSPVQTYETTVIWATDNYSERGDEYGFKQPIQDLSIIVPRVDKSKAEQKRRVKDKAEVFTPSWVCNVQNNLIDDHLLKPNVFNKVSEDKKSWTSTKRKVPFTKDYTWLDYIVERRLELACGEGPYLMSPYDTTTGKGIPVRDDEGKFSRIGLLDRKLRVVYENVFKDFKKDRTGRVVEEIDEKTKEQWVNYAMLSLVNTFGYEWQGDNLLLARLNMLNTFIEYYEDVFNEMPNNELILEVSEIASWNLWQMDGLKMVEPMSCDDNCKACKNKKRIGHNGKISVIRFLTSEGFALKAFEDLLPIEMSSKNK